MGGFKAWSLSEVGPPELRPLRSWDADGPKFPARAARTSFRFSRPEHAPSLSQTVRSFASVRDATTSLVCCPWGDPEVLVGWPSAQSCNFSRLCRPLTRLTHANMKRSRRIIQLPGPRLGRTRGLARFCDVPGWPHSFRTAPDVATETRSNRKCLSSQTKKSCRHFLADLWAALYRD
jgi:hypothetical protein